MERENEVVVQRMTNTERDRQTDREADSHRGCVRVNVKKLFCRKSQRPTRMNCDSSLSELRLKMRRAVPQINTKPDLTVSGSHSGESGLINYFIRRLVVTGFGIHVDVY